MGLTLCDESTPDSILQQAAKFSVFSVFEKSAKEKEVFKQNENVGLWEVFYANGVCVTFEKVRIHIRSNDKLLNLSLEYTYKKTSEELKTLIFYLKSVYKFKSYLTFKLI